MEEQVKKQTVGLKLKKDFQLQAVPELTESELEELAKAYALKYDKPEHLVQAKRLAFFAQCYASAIEQKVIADREQHEDISGEKTEIIAAAKMTISTRKEFDYTVDTLYAQKLAAIKSLEQAIEPYKKELKAYEKTLQLSLQPVKEKKYISISISKHY
jgi:hypothetical protein